MFRLFIASRFRKLSRCSLETASVRRRRIISFNNDVNYSRHEVSLTFNVYKSDSYFFFYLIDGDIIREEKTSYLFFNVMRK